MVIAKIKVDGVTAVATELSQIPKGIQGATIEVTYDGAWGSLNKTAVFSGSVVKDVVNVGAVISVPPETVAKSGHHLRVGFYGVDGENKVIIPTLWVDLGAIQSAADPSGDASTNTSLPVWAQLQADVEALKGAGGGTGTGATAEQAAQITQNKENIEKLSGEKLDASKLPEAVNNALAQAKASGEFKGEPGKDGTPGADGKDYILTEADKTEIADMTAGLVEVPTDDHINQLINTALGVIENGTY